MDDVIFVNLKIGAKVKVFSRIDNKFVGVGIVIEIRNVRINSNTVLYSYPRQVEILNTDFNDFEYYFTPI